MMSGNTDSSLHGRRTEEALDAARCGQAYEVEEAIHLGADVCASDPHGMTALHYAAARYTIYFTMTSFIFSPL